MAIITNYLMDRVERCLILRNRDQRGGYGRPQLQHALNLTRQTLWRYMKKGTPDWMLFALLGVVVSDGNRNRAAQLLEQELERALPREKPTILK